MALRKGPAPVMLTKLEALAHAASQLRELAQTFQMIAMLDEAAAKSQGGSPEARAAYSQLARETPEPGLQAKACHDAARAIEEMALEERLVAVRAQRAEAERASAKAK
jgi:hypothetical protein